VNPHVKRRYLVIGWTGWTLAHFEFWVSVNPISTRGADYTHHINACLPGYEKLTTSLKCIFSLFRLLQSYIPKYSKKSNESCTVFLFYGPEAAQKGLYSLEINGIQ
jgi:hypothetical protein